jgi:gluconokinase
VIALDDGVPTTLVVMGVSGSGKTTVARALADRLGWPYVEGDDFHPPANVEKMRSGHALDDDDRWPWLRALAAWIGQREAEHESCVVTCSALKRSYRELLCESHPSVRFVHVSVDVDTLRSRLQSRRGHYMPASLLDSQLATLEPLAPDEPGLVVSGDGPPAAVVDHIVTDLTRRRAAPTRQGDGP